MQGWFIWSLCKADGEEGFVLLVFSILYLKRGCRAWRDHTASLKKQDDERKSAVSGCYAAEPAVLKLCREECVAWVERGDSFSIIWSLFMLKSLEISFISCPIWILIESFLNFGISLFAIDMIHSVSWLSNISMLW